MATKDLAKRQAAAVLWHRGILTWKLDNTQKDLYKVYTDSPHRVVVWACSRRLGKSWSLCVIAVEQCLKKGNSIVKFIAPTAKHVRMIINPLFKEILKDCPKELRPKFLANENVYRFANGSEIQIAGIENGNAESLRGGSSDVCLVDEAGFCPDLRYVVQSILIPTTTTTNGKIVLSSTPPKSNDHEFIEYMKEAEYRGSFIKKTIYDNKRISIETINELRAELGGENSIEFRREYLCENIPDSDYAVVPEFTADVQAETIRDWPRPPFFDIYVAGDVGFRDLTAFIFAYYDFRSDKLIIEDELELKQMNTDQLAAGIKEKEFINFSDAITKETKPPYLRVCDNNLIVISDLQRLHKLNFIPTAKDDSNAALNNLRIWVSQRRVIINPRCKNLIYHLKNAVWNKSKSKYERSANAGHYDFVDALKYLIRNIQPSHNPYPANYMLLKGDDAFRAHSHRDNRDLAAAVRKMLRIDK